MALVAVRFRPSELDDALLVYQMGKVGSEAVSHMLRDSFPARRVFHIHSLNGDTLDWLWDEKVRLMSRTIETHLLYSRQLRKVIDRQDHLGRRWKIISLVRDPIAVVVSAFFQVVDYYIPRFVERFEAGEIEIDEATSVFEHTFPYHRWPLDWFDSEIKAVFGLDIFAEGFPKEQGYNILQNEEVELLTIRLEDLDRCVAVALHDYLGIENVQLGEQNRSSAKPYAGAYAAFQDAVSFSAAYLSRAYEHKYSTHFYDSSEIARFKERWNVRPVGSEHQ